MFIDNAKILVRGGDGGRGCASLYSDKYLRRGVPDGGDGGDGADIIIKADHRLFTLLDFRYNKHFYGKHGGHGSGKQQRGKNAEDIIIRVPLGTIIKDALTGCVLRDLSIDEEQVIVARGGRGGMGNRHHVDATPGTPGEEKEITLDLKLIAAVGVVGFPNAGKSTLICAISNAHTKIAAYPFTTKSPVLGVVNLEEKKFVIADIPGLIEGASLGKGLGDKFLKHIERTQMIVHIIDMAGFEGRDPLEDYKKINIELKAYSADLAAKHQIICANKMDLEGAKENLVRFKKSVKKPVFAISALNKQGLEELVDAIAKKI
ncbi:MAG: GTPase ObgE [Candidatus Omnitrophica bacterium]|jgi:GTP-binding protein|nr:GTPase ObgE [Candidatus Omnitrophota bacterium]